MSTELNEKNQSFLSSAPICEVPRCLKVRSVKREMTTFSDALKLTNYERAAHVCFYAPCNKQTTFGNYKAMVMMHLRFDGTLGFPGGLIDENEDVLVGLTRELKEEAAYDPSLHGTITYANYHSTRVLQEKALVLHFFVKKLTQEHFETLEKNVINAPEYGKEVFGTIRVPLYTMTNLYGGLPAFLNNRFVGCAKQELLMALFSEGVFNDDEIDQLIHNANNLKLAPSRM